MEKLLINDVEELTGVTPKPPQSSIVVDVGGGAVDRQWGGAPPEPLLSSVIVNVGGGAVDRRRGGAPPESRKSHRDPPLLST